MLTCAIIIRVSDMQRLNRARTLLNVTSLSMMGKVPETSCLFLKVTLVTRDTTCPLRSNIHRYNERYVSSVFVTLVPSSRGRVNQSLGRPSHEFLVTGSSKFSGRNQCGDSVPPSAPLPSPCSRAAPTVFLSSHLLGHVRSLLAVTLKAMRTVAATW